MSFTLDTKNSKKKEFSNCHFEIISAGLESRNGHTYEGVLKIIKPINQYLMTKFKPTEKMMTEFCGTERRSHISFELKEDGLLYNIHSFTHLGGEFDQEIINLLKNWMPPKDWQIFPMMNDTYLTEIRAIQE